MRPIAESSTEKVLSDAVHRARQELGRQPELLAATLSMIGDLYSGLGQTATADSLVGEALAMQERFSANQRPIAH